MLKKKFSIFAFFLLVLFALLTYQSIKGESHFLDFLLYPLKLVEQGSTAVTRSVRNVFSTYFLIIGKEEENKNLVAEIHKLREEVNKSVEARLENQRLRELLRLKAERHDYVTSAGVFARDPTNWFQMLWINKGSNDGIDRDMVAVTPLGPVGRIHKVFGERASIILLTDVNSSVAVSLQSSRAEGILEGKGDDTCYLKYISKDVDVKAGEKIVTSGLEGIYPRGLQVGHVEYVEKDEEEVFQMIEVVLSQNLNSIEEVAILKR